MSLLIRHDGPVLYLRLDRPDRAHAYNAAVLEALATALSAIEAQPPAVLVVESTGSGAFCAGADLKEMAQAPPLQALDLRSQLLFTRLARLPCVSIAAIQGAAVAGGLELALACDLRVAGPKARFWLPETALGILPSAGGTTRLARLIGVSRAKEVILGGRQVDAETALNWGLVHRLAEDPHAETALWASQIVQRNPLALRLAKQILDTSESQASLALERVSEALLYSEKSNSTRSNNKV